VCKVRDLKPALLFQFKRAGTIIYREIDDDMEFVLGEDRDSGDKSNFAGRPFRCEDALTAASREFCEETLKVFGRLDRKRLLDSWAVYNSEELIIFYNLNYNKEESIYKFSRRVKANSEMQKLYFCNLDQFFDLLTRNQDGGIYSRVRSLLVNAFDGNGLFLSNVSSAKNKDFIRSL
jgi:hypothetical protein